MNLYELSNAYKNVSGMVDELEEDVFLDTIASIEVPLNEKAENIARFIKNIEAEAEIYKKESQKMAEKATSRTNKAKRLKLYLQESLELAGMDKVQGELFTVAIQNNPPKLIVEDESEIPKAYWLEQPPKLDRRLLLQDLKLEEYPDFKGARVVQERSLRIR